eukprot:727941_1
MSASPRSFANGPQEIDEPVSSNSEDLEAVAGSPTHQFERWSSPPSLPSRMSDPGVRTSSSDSQASPRLSRGERVREKFGRFVQRHSRRKPETGDDDAAVHVTTENRREMGGPLLRIESRDDEPNAGVSLARDQQSTQDLDHLSNDIALPEEQKEKHLPPNVVHPQTNTAPSLQKQLCAYEKSDLFKQQRALVQQLCSENKSLHTSIDHQKLVHARELEQRSEELENKN